MIAALHLLWDEDFFEMVIYVFDFSYTFTSASFMLESDISGIPHTYTFYPFGLDSFSSFSCALPFGFGNIYFIWFVFCILFFELEFKIHLHSYGYDRFWSFVRGVVTDMFPRAATHVEE